MSMPARRVDELSRRAAEVARCAWAPYSGFRVGAVLIASDGRTFSGCNVENASFGLTMCAERVAIGRAIAEGCRDFEAIVIHTDSDEPAAPCGACRQVLAEFAGDDLEVVLVGAGGRTSRTTLGALLPAAFRRSSFGRDAGSQESAP